MSTQGRLLIADDELSEEYIIPSVFDPRVVDAVAKAVGAAAVDEGVARRSSVMNEEEELDTKV